MDYITTKLLRKAAAYASRREMCRWDLQGRLRTWKASPPQIEAIMDYLEKEGYINEVRFCQSFVNDKFRFNQWGKIKIAQALQAKHVSPAIYQPVLDAIDPEKYTQVLDLLLAKKAPLVKGQSKFERQGKLINFALQHGFEFEVAEHIVNLKNYE